MWWKNRRDFYDNEDAYDVDASIAVVGYNRLDEKTKLCVESIIEHTKGVDYQLILVDSGSSDGTYDYFSRVEFENKISLRIEKNLGLSYALSCARKCATGRFFAFVANDCIVTERWLENLLTCIKSNPRIGMVCPGASNVSNAQSINIGRFSNWNEMQKLAAKHNVSNPALWEYRPRLVNPVALYRSEVLDLIGDMDPGFTHNFGEDDIARGIHRNGYRMVLCKDTYIEHNHVRSERESDELKVDLEDGKRVFMEKYHGIDPWNDVNNYIFPYIGELGFESSRSEKIGVLGVNVRCGTPFFDVINRLKAIGIGEDLVDFHAYSTDVKYYTDLVAYPAIVNVSDVEKLKDIYSVDSMDIIVSTEDVDKFSSPLDYLSDLVDIVKKGGFILIPIRNKNDIMFCIDCMLGDRSSDERRSFLTNEMVLTKLDELDVEQVWITDERYQERLRGIVSSQFGNQFDAYVSNEADCGVDSLFVERYWLLIKK